MLFYIYETITKVNDKLQSICEQRHTFIGIFEQSGMLSICWHQPQPTLLLKNIKNRQGTIIVKQIWVSLTKELDALELKQGDIICFDAMVMKYMGIYKLNYPTKISKIKNYQPERCEPNLSKIRNFCTKCGETRSTKFHVSRHHQCKECYKKATMESRQTWKANNPNYGKEYFKKNKNKLLQYAKVYRQKNKEKISRYYKEWYANGGRKDLTEFKCPKCGETNPEKFYRNRHICKPCLKNQALARKTKPTKY